MEINKKVNSIRKQFPVGSQMKVISTGRIITVEKLEKFESHEFNYDGINYQGIMYDGKRNDKQLVWRNPGNEMFVEKV